MVANEKQLAAWNGGESVHYVANAERYDRQLAPFTDVLLEQVRLAEPRTLLEVGCGCGALTLAAARIAEGVVGVDISEPLTEIASRRAAVAQLGNVEFRVADAQTCDFGSDGFDLVVSQFGLMFFDDPVLAFRNLRRPLSSDGTIAFICWQRLAANDWLWTIATEVSKHSELPPFGGLSRGPGMFALMDQNETRELLEQAGYLEVGFEAVELPILIGGGGPLEESLDFLLGMGMVKGLIGIAGPDARDSVIDGVREVLAERYEPGVGLAMGAAGWMVTARA